MRIKRQGMRRGISLLPNMLTTFNLFCGFFSITKSVQGQYIFAAWMIVLAGVFDFLDGRVARMTKTQSDFGVEYDSLSDLTTFCLAPAILIYQWSLFDFNKVGIAVCFLYFACGALRLARFNVQAGSIEKVDFQGLPTPMAGGFLVSYVLFYDHYFASGQNPSLLVLVFTIITALLMVSNVKYRSSKRVKRASFLVLVLLVGMLFVIAAQPETMLFLIAVVYITSGIVEWLWTSPQKIRNLKDLFHRVYNDRREILVYDDEDEDDSYNDQITDADNVVELAKKDKG